MFERFTDRARRILVMTQEEATRRGHNYIGTEHILLGLLDSNSSSVPSTGGPPGPTHVIPVARNSVSHPGHSITGSKISPFGPRG